MYKKYTFTLLSSLKRYKKEKERGEGREGRHVDTFFTTRRSLPHPSSPSPFSLLTMASTTIRCSLFLISLALLAVIITIIDVVCHYISFLHIFFCISFYISFLYIFFIYIYIYIFIIVNHFVSVFNHSKFKRERKRKGDHGDEEGVQ